MSLKKSYLFLYNLIQFIGCLTVIISVVRYNIEHGKTAKNGLSDFPLKGSYGIGSPMARIVIILQWIEILHSLIGLSKGSPFASIIQVGFKSFIFFGLMEAEPRIHDMKFTPVLLVIWCLADAIRYPFYLLQLANKSCYPITWIRYSAWILLYPLGIALEAVVAYNNLDYLKSSGRMSYRLPNQLNFSFDVVSFLYFYLSFGIIIGSKSILSYMWGQRKKVLDR